MCIRDSFRAGTVQENTPVPHFTDKQNATHSDFRAGTVQENTPVPYFTDKQNATHSDFRARTVQENTPAPYFTHKLDATHSDWLQGQNCTGKYTCSTLYSQTGRYTLWLTSGPELYRKIHLLHTLLTNRTLHTTVIIGCQNNDLWKEKPTDLDKFHDGWEVTSQDLVSHQSAWTKTAQSQ